MRLLVSVRSAAEVGPALAGGADVIDAKEPSLGSLGAVSLATLEEIVRVVPRLVPLSVALGDLSGSTEVARAVALVGRVADGRKELYLKLGLAGTPDPADAVRLVSAAVEAAHRAASPMRVVVVAYADHVVAGAPSAEVVARVARRAGVEGILLDTFGKDGRDLFHQVEEMALRSWVCGVREAGMLAALAGSLDEEGVRRVAAMPADIVGVRGAACGGPRSGMVAEASVRALKAAMHGVVATSA